MRSNPNVTGFKYWSNRFSHPDKIKRGGREICIKWREPI